jgi:iron complex outermembrane receptor protein
VDSSLWVAKFNHYIYGQLTGRTCDDTGSCVADDSLDLRELDYRQADATFRGAEVKVTLPLYDAGAGKLSAETFADVVRATLADGGGNVPRIPPYHLSAGMRWTGERLDSGLFVKYSGRQNDTAAAETPTAGYVSVDGYLGWRPVAANSHLELTLVAHNLTDSVQHNPVAINKDQVTLPGRDLRLMVRATL